MMVLMTFEIWGYFGNYTLVGHLWWFLFHASSLISKKTHFWSALCSVNQKYYQKSVKKAYLRWTDCSAIRYLFSDDDTHTILYNVTQNDFFILFDLASHHHRTVIRRRGPLFKVLSEGHNVIRLKTTQIFFHSHNTAQCQHNVQLFKRISHLIKSCVCLC